MHKYIWAGLLLLSFSSSLAISISHGRQISPFFSLQGNHFICRNRIANGKLSVFIFVKEESLICFAAMIVMLRRASKAFEILKRGRSICNQTKFWFSNRWHNSDSAATYGNDAKISGSSEFLRWHNGGGIFHRSASIDPTVCIEIGAVVHPNSVLGLLVGSGTIVGPSVSIKESTKVGYNVVLSNCSIGQFCIIHNGVCIGQDGFGFFVDEEGPVCKKLQILHARIGDHVEIGANTCIDRGSWRDTVVGDYTKIDNL